MPVSATSVAVSLIEKRFQSFTAAPIAVVGDGTLEFDPSIQEDLNGAGDSPAGPQPVAATWTVANVRSTYGYVQLTVEVLEGSSVGLTAGLSGSSFYRPLMDRMTARFAVVSPPRHTHAQVQAIFRLIRLLYERAALTDAAHADWPLLQVMNRPLNDDGGSAWREILEADIADGWRHDRITGEFETTPYLQPYASASGAPIDLTL